LIEKYIHEDLLYKIPEKYTTTFYRNEGILKLYRQGLKPTKVIIRKLSSYTNSEINRKNIDTEYKYNIEVENHHTYIANRYIAHNCDGDPLDFYSRESLNWMHYCFFQSHFGAIEVKQVNPKLIGEVVYPAVDPKVFHKLDKEKLKEEFNLTDFTIFICNARGQQRKNVPVLLDAFKEIIEEDSQVALILPSGVLRAKTDVGNLDGYDLDRFVASLGIEAHVFMPRSMQGGPIDDKSLNLQYNLADINILPSIGEGFGLPFIEAGIVSVPSIGVNHSAVREVVRDRGLLVEPRTYMYNNDGSRYHIPHPDDIKDAMLKLMKDKKLIKQYGDEAYKFAKKLTPESRAKQMLDAFEKLIKDDAKPPALR
jgi:glycosyltransferase involved in cell wall biosynthesis